MGMHRRDTVVETMVKMMGAIILVVLIAGFAGGIQFYRLWLRRLHKISVNIRKAQRGGK